jgi:alkanesulfonate monooxygenase SsuD/methylene tetrahydromethanopterin reductase-like flavin-dependent oxidoreductase (luciferase family)
MSIGLSANLGLYQPVGSLPAVNVGIYFDLRNPSEWRRSWHELYSFTLELCEQADDAGLHSAWFTEHHLVDYLTQPLTFAAAVAARTHRLRVCTSIVIAPLRPAILIAEEAALVDQLSGGRLELGLGAGYRPEEFDAYGADFQSRFRVVHERAREIRRIWESPEALPPPAQKRLPIWMGSTGRASARATGRMGEGLLRIDPSIFPAYLEALEEAGHGASAARVAGGVNGFLLDDPDRDWPVIAPHVRYRAESYAAWGARGAVPGHPETVDPDELRALGITGGGMKGFLCETPEVAAERIRAACEGLPVETVYIWATIPGIDEALTRRNVELVSTKLAPLLADA